MTTSIVLETSRGDIQSAVALGIILILIAFLINLALNIVKRLEIRIHGYKDINKIKEYRLVI